MIVSTQNAPMAPLVSMGLIGTPASVQRDLLAPFAPTQYLMNAPPVRAEIMLLVYVLKMYIFVGVPRDFLG